MPFMVIHTRADGSSGYEQVDAIDEAARFVESLRNAEQSDQIRIYRMEEIGFAFRPYYRVELGLPERQGPVVPPPTEPLLAAEERASEPEPEMASVGTDALPLPAPGNDGDGPVADGRRGLFGR